MRHLKYPGAISCIYVYQIIKKVERYTAEMRKNLVFHWPTSDLNNCVIPSLEYINSIYAYQKSLILTFISSFSTSE